MSNEGAYQAREPVNMLQSTAEPTVVDCSTVQAHEGVYFTCPLCPASALQSEIDAHLSECLEKVQYVCCNLNLFLV